MSTIEFTGCSSGLFCALLLSTWLGSMWGWIGRIVGLPIGFFGGFISGFVLLGVLQNFSARTFIRERRRDLQDRFGEFWSAERIPAWEAMRQSLHTGDEVTGTVLRKYYWGVLMEIGGDFPAELTQLYTNEETKAADPAIGARVTARVRDFNEEEHIIQLTQKETSSAYVVDQEQ